MAKRIRLEIALESVDDALTAVAAGADRLEICAGLDCGGLTPSAGVVAQIRRAVSVPILAMIRPRNGGFCYSEREFETMRADVQSLCAAGIGASGIVSGILMEDGRVDEPRCRIQARESPGEELVFHRAFDLTPDPLAALEQLIELGFTRILTSGGMPRVTHPAALERVAMLRESARGRIEILPASGIRSDNVRELLARTGCDQVHAACRMRRQDMRVPGQPCETLGAINGASQDTYGVTSREAVEALRAAIDQFGETAA